MELGALVGAVPRKNVVRMKPEPGDVVILVGGRTGRDGCGGATRLFQGARCGASDMWGRSAERATLHLKEYSKAVQSAGSAG